ncbi:MAG TPA: ATP-binding cassette domain-containing protein [Vicinamibacterales bacterium]|jgi:sodium transport system ATP-binding protein|nr:ATP-binding cassette domain-containing protein [Vicinamibacterales bacterium]
MIEVRNLRKAFGPVRAVSDVSFRASNGRITGILGENGAGKTTTLALICGLLRPDEGWVRVGPDDSSPIERRRRLGALLDHKGLYDRLTARENIAYFGRLQGVLPCLLERRVEDVLARLDLARVADRRVAGFSQGERMKVALGRAIVHSPAHVLLDEPTNGLDIPSVHGLREVLRRMRDSGTCILFSTHVLDEVRALCDNVVIISRGRVVAQGDQADICRLAGCATLEEAFLALTHREVVCS